MSVSLRIKLFYFLFLLFNLNAEAKYSNETVKVAPIFQSHMVLQQNQPITIWGTATNNKRIEVELGGKIKYVTANKVGEWSVIFESRKASFTPVNMRVDKQHFTGILIGEVWICTGQSNMAFPLKNSDFPDLKMKYINPNLRLLRMDYIRGTAKDGYDKAELDRCNVKDFFKGKWEESGTKTAADFSAAAWIMGNRLQTTLKVPIGLIEIAVGGSAINNWLPPTILKKLPLTANLYKTDWLENDDVFINHRNRAKDAFKNILKEDEPFIPGKMPYRWMCEPGFLFEAGIMPLKDFGIKGVVWYQGESDAYADQPAQDYEVLFEQLIVSWRKFFKMDSLPFVFVQLPGYKATYWPILREKQRLVDVKIPNTSMVVSIDLGLEDNVHPPDKTPIGDRLSRLVLKNIYKREKIEGFPSLKKIDLKNNGNLVLHFNDCEKGWQLTESKIPGFEIMDKNGIYHSASAEVTKTQNIILKSDVDSPICVRYGWSPFPTPKLILFNKARLPLGPFVEIINRK